MTCPYSIYSLVCFERILPRANYNWILLLQFHYGLKDLSILFSIYVYTLINQDSYIFSTVLARMLKGLNDVSLKSLPRCSQSQIRFIFLLLEILLMHYNVKPLENPLWLLIQVLFMRKHFYSTKLNLTFKFFTKTGFFVKIE